MAAPNRPRKLGTDWAAYAAAVAAFAFAAVSLYWAVGGTAGLATVGSELEELARARKPTVIAAVWAAVVLKLLGGLLALALVQAWGGALPRWLLLTAAWGGSAVLVLYGVLQMGAAALVELGVVKVDGPVDWTALRWHLVLWDPWFLVWGLLLALATWRYTRLGHPASSAVATKHWDAG